MNIVGSSSEAGNESAADNAAGAAPVGSQYPSSREPQIAVPAPAQPDTWECMVGQPRWLLWKRIPQAGKKDRKVPYYAAGDERGDTDTPEDRQRLVTFEEACQAYRQGVDRYAGIAFALGPDGTGWHWQGIDVDEVPDEQLSDVATGMPGYVERSPSGRGLHAIGYGRHFQTLGANGSNVEAYAGGRYFTVTRNVIRDAPLACIADFVEQVVAKRHTSGRNVAAGASASSVTVDPKTITELRSALSYLRADERDTWISVGQALKELGETGRALWWDWSQTSAKCNPQDARKWDSFDGDRTGYRAVFAKAQAAGWVNPNSNAAQIPSTPVRGGFAFEHARHGVEIVETEYLNDPWLPRGTVIGCYGRGEAGKSSWTAQICAAASGQVSTLWISSEERQDHIMQRHLSCGGEERTLSVLEDLPTKLDPINKKPVATPFNVYEHMEGAILTHQRDPGRADRPLGIVVLDAVVALVTWGKGESANDDAGVKRLIAHLFSLAERYNVTFMILGHLNKGSNHEHVADAVTGSAAWTNSVRLAFLFRKNLESDDYEGFIRTAKTNTGTHFGAVYRTKPVYTLRQRPDGHNDVLCGAEQIGDIVWGEVALREMMGGEGDDRWLNAREQKAERVKALVDAIVQALKAGGTPTRKSVELTLGRQKVHRRDWVDAEARLSLLGVQVNNLERGLKSYSWRGL
jgi:hypothetical protein